MSTLRSNARLRDRKLIFVSYARDAAGVVRSNLVRGRRLEREPSIASKERASAQSGASAAAGPKCAQRDALRAIGQEAK
jgi:hypothetical protein